jgi:hypothetical protein
MWRTSNARTRMMRTSGRLVANISARLAGSEKAGSGTIPTRPSIGSTSSRCAPWGSRK